MVLRVGSNDILILVLVIYFFHPHPPIKFLDWCMLNGDIIFESLNLLLLYLLPSHSILSFIFFRWLIIINISQTPKGFAKKTVTLFDAQYYQYSTCQPPMKIQVVVLHVAIMGMA